jgi:hypothetical protein
MYSYLNHHIIQLVLKLISKNSNFKIRLSVKSYTNLEAKGSPFVMTLHVKETLARQIFLFEELIL